MLFALRERLIRITGSAGTPGPPRFSACHPATAWLRCAPARSDSLYDLIGWLASFATPDRPSARFQPSLVTAAAVCRDTDFRRSTLHGNLGDMVTTHKRTARAPAFQLRPVARAVLGAFLAGAVAGVHGGPLGPEVSAGTGKINQAGSVITVDQSSPRLSINWRASASAPANPSFSGNLRHRRSR